MADESTGKAITFVEVDTDAYRITRFETAVHGVAPVDWTLTDGTAASVSLLGIADPLLLFNKGIRIKHPGASSYAFWRWNTLPEYGDVSVVANFHTHDGNSGFVQHAIHARRTSVNPFSGYALYFFDSTTVQIRRGDGADWDASIASATLDPPLTYGNFGITITDTNAGGSPHAWTTAGNAAILRPASLWGTTVESEPYGYLNVGGSGDYVTTPDHADFTLGSGDWTVDFWFQVTAAGGTQLNMCGQSSDGAAANSAWYILKNTGNVIVASAFVGGVASTVVGTVQYTSAVNTGTHHLAFVRTGNILRLFIDGVQQGGDVAITGTVNDVAHALSVGRIGSLATDTFIGFFDNFRLSVGSARWTATFTPPNKPYSLTFGNDVFTKILLPFNPPIGPDVWMKMECVGTLVRGKVWEGALTDEPPAWLVSFDDAGEWANVLLHCNGTDGSTDIADEFGHIWTAVQNAQIDTSTSVFGGASLQLTTLGDYITTPAHEDFDLGQGDFTLDFWFNTNQGGGTQLNLCGQGGPAGAVPTLSVYIQRTTANVIIANIVTAAFTVGTITGTSTYTNATGWAHFALTRSGNTIRMFLNGTQEGGNFNFVGPVNRSFYNFSIGRAGEYAGEPYGGRIDEFRLLKGSAMWTSNFTPPVNPYRFGRGYSGVGVRISASDFSCTHFRAQSLLSDVTETLRYTKSADYLHYSTLAVPNLIDASVTPMRVSLGENLGERGTLQASFKDHRHADMGELFDNGSHWGKMRARGLLRRGLPVRLKRGFLDEEIEKYETRNYILETQDGPSSGGGFNILAKDILKLADDERALCPVPTNGFLVAGINNSVTSATLSPSGIGNLEYTASGHVAIGGKEICSFTRSGDVLTITRGLFNTTAIAHDAEARVQLCHNFSSNSPASVISNLLRDFAGVPNEMIPVDNWVTEVDTFLQRNYARMIPEPTGVRQLVSELIEQAGLAVWPDDLSQQVRLQVLRAIPTTAFRYDSSNTIAGSIQCQDQLNKKVTQVLTYFGVRNPLEPLDQPENYRSALTTVDLEEETFSDSSVTKVIYGSWIPFLARTTAERINDLMLGRFKKAPRRFMFDVMRRGPDLPEPGGGYRLQWYGSQDEAGDAITAPIEVTSVNPMADRVRVEAEEMLATEFSVDDLLDRAIVIDTNVQNFDLYQTYIVIYGTPTAQDVIDGVTLTVTVQAGIVIGSNSTATPAFVVDSTAWPASFPISLIVNGRIQGCGGAGGGSASPSNGNGQNAFPGGTALYTRTDIDLTSTNGEIFGGGGGGGGGSAQPGAPANTGSGGGGAGTLPGAGGPDNFPPATGVTDGAPGTADAGGTSGASSGGVGGGPGLAGSNGSPSAPSFVGGTGGAAGAAIDGDSFTTDIGAAGDIRGGQIN